MPDRASFDKVGEDNTSIQLSGQSPMKITAGQNESTINRSSVVVSSDQNLVEKVKHAPEDTIDDIVQDSSIQQTRLS